MSGPQFFNTLMGRKFFEVDVPHAICTFEKAIALGERLIVALERAHPPGPTIDDLELVRDAQKLAVPVPAVPEKVDSDNSMEWSCVECGGTEVWTMVSQQLNTGERMISSNELVDVRCMECFMRRHKNSTKARFGPKKEIKP